MPRPTKRRDPRGACDPLPRVAGGRLPHKDEIQSALKGSPDAFCSRTNQEQNGHCSAAAVDPTKHSSLFRGVLLTWFRRLPRFPAKRSWCRREPGERAGIFMSQSTNWDERLNGENGFCITRFVFAALVVLQHSYFLPFNSIQAEPL